ncbi:MAG: DUF86 domain-containing protein [Thermotogaceae bacterium]|nr:DUF86 domain-containing protein [Thermotogaceae bacterium]
MSKRSVKCYLQDILDAIEKIKKYTAKVDYEMFSKNQMMIDAVLMNIAIIGESVKKIPEDVKERYPDIPWKDIAGMRDKVIHDYFGVDVNIVWETIRKNVPELEQKIKVMLKEL